MNRHTYAELTSWPNLLSLSRIPLGLLGILALRNPSDQFGVRAIAVCAVAALTDWLDGILARRAPHISPIGVAIDPLADKLFAGIMVIGLMLYRDFPLWLVVMIICRDAVIVGVGSWLMQKKRVSLPSNLFGKYAFAFLLGLMLSYVLRFPFGIDLLLPVTVLLLLLSFISYVIVGLRVLRGNAAVLREPSPIALFVRVTLSSTIVSWYLIELWRFLH